MSSPRLEIFKTTEISIFATITYGVNDICSVLDTKKRKIPEFNFTYFFLFSEVYYEKQRYDGWFNNRAYPDWGSVGEYP